MGLPEILAQGGLSESFRTTFVLVFFALPLSVVLGGAVFVPHKALWRLSHLAHVLRSHGWVVAGLILMLVPEVIESQLDPTITAWLGLDFTPWMAAVDGDLHLRLQRALDHPALHAFFSAVYVGGYPFLIIFTVCLGIWMDKGAFARRALAAYALCYAFALPFYLLFPVDEVWSYANPDNAPGGVRNLALQYAFVKEHLYSFNAINNCFPSLHTGIAAAMAGVAWRGPSKAYRWFTATLAALIAFSTIYLGIHWTLDLLAGLVLAAIVVALVHKWRPDPPADDVPTAAA